MKYIEEMNSLELTTYFNNLRKAGKTPLELGTFIKLSSKDKKYVLHVLVERLAAGCEVDRNYELSLETINDIYPFKKGIAVGDIVRSRLQHPEMAFQGEVLGFEESTGRVIVISTHRNKHTDRCRYSYKPDELEVVSRGRHQSDVSNYQECIEQFEFEVGESYVVNESYVMNLREIDVVGNLCLFSIGDSFMKIVYPTPKNLREANIRKLQRF